MSKKSRVLDPYRAPLVSPLEGKKGHVAYEKVQRQPELIAKWLDTNWATVANVSGVSIGNATSITTSGSHYNITAIATGTDRINRIGRHIIMRGFEIRGLFEAGKENLILAGDFNNCIRVMLWRPRAPDPITSASSITSNLFPVGDAVTGIPDADDVAEIYFDKTMLVRVTYGPNSTGSGTATQTAWQHYLHEVVRFKVPVVYNNTGAANVSQNQVILSCWSDSSIAPNPAASCSFRVFFEDDD